MPFLTKREYSSPTLRVRFFSMKTETKAESASVLKRVPIPVVGEGMKIVWGMLDACIPLEPIALGHVRNYGSTNCSSSTTRFFQGVYGSGDKLSIGQSGQWQRARTEEKMGREVKGE